MGDEGDAGVGEGELAEGVGEVAAGEGDPLGEAEGDVGGEVDRRVMEGGEKCGVEGEGVDVEGFEELAGSRAVRSDAVMGQAAEGSPGMGEKMSGV